MLVILFFKILDKQKVYDEHLSKLDAVLTDVENLKKNLASVIKRRKVAERKVDDLKAKMKFANKNRFGDKSYKPKMMLLKESH